MSIGKGSGILKRYAEYVCRGHLFKGTTKKDIRALINIVFELRTFFILIKLTTPHVPFFTCSKFKNKIIRALNCIISKVRLCHKAT